MYLVLLAAISVMVLIFNIFSIKSFILKKTTLVNLFLGFFLLAIIISYLLVLILMTTNIVNVLDDGVSLNTLKVPMYMMSAWFLSVFLFIKIGKKRFAFFLYRSVFIEENEEENEEADLEAQMSEERRKTYKKQNIDVKEVPNFVQKFTSTYFKIKNTTKKVSDNI
jgi:amino acid permease